MGFGALFLAYILILNIAYFSFTDLLCALMLLLGTYKLSAVEKSYKYASFALVPFAILGIFELVTGFASIFGKELVNETVMTVIGIIRYLLITAFSYYILLGIEKLAAEVDLPLLKSKAKRQKILTLTVFPLTAFFELPILGSILPLKALAIIAVVLLISAFAVSILTLFVIYSAYMHICMPSDLVYKEKTSKLGFVNRFREHEEQKRREYADYKIEKFKESNSKNKKKGKRK